MNSVKNEVSAKQAILDKYAADIKKRRLHEFGYPINHNSNLKEFYNWYLQTESYNIMSDNAGDPHDIHQGGPFNALEIEREVIDFFGPLYGFNPDDLWGIMTFSGTDGNNHGIYFGAKYLEQLTKKKPVVYVSDEAHYSNRRLADLQNLKLVIVPSDIHGCMIPEELEKRLLPDSPALMVYALGTTFKGGSDDIDALNAVLAKHPEITTYRHVDAALFGGYLPFTEYKDAVNHKIHHFDSIAISGHKFFGIDEPAGLFLTTMKIRKNQNTYNISYLNGDMPMINCSRSALAALKLWWIINKNSTEEMSRQAKGLLERASWLKEQLDKLSWPAWLEPLSNTVYFKRPAKEIVAQYGLAPDYDERLGGELSHIVVMQHVTQTCLQSFLDDLKK